MRSPTASAPSTASSRSRAWECDVTPVDEGAPYVYACQETREADRLFREAFAALNLVVIPPIVYDEAAAIVRRIVKSSPSDR